MHQSGRSMVARRLDHTWSTIAARLAMYTSASGSCTTKYSMSRSDDSLQMVSVWIQSGAWLGAFFW